MKSGRKAVAENSARLLGPPGLFWRPGEGPADRVYAGARGGRDPRLDALIGTGISGRKAAVDGYGVSGSPDEAEIRPVQAVRGWVHRTPRKPRKTAVWGFWKDEFRGQRFF